MSDYLIIQLARIGDLVQSKRLLLTLERLGRVHLALDRGLLDLAALLYPKAVLHPLRAHAGSAAGSGVQIGRAGGGNASGMSMSALSASGMSMSGLSASGMSMSALSASGATLTDNAVAFAELARQDFTAVYNLNRSPLALIVSGLFPPEIVHGYRLDNGQALCSNWSRLASRWTADRQSSPLNLVDFWAFFHPLAHEVVSPEAVNPPACPKHPFGREHVVGVVMAGREARRSLPPDYLAACLEALFTARKGPRLLLLGGGSEQDAARRLCRRLKPATLQRTENLCGKTSLPDLHALLQGLDLVVTPDTGAMHLAAHLGVPVFATFLSSAWALETGPYGLGHRIWQAWQPEFRCTPCLESAACPHGVACLAPFAAPARLECLAGRSGRGWQAGRADGAIQAEQAGQAGNNAKFDLIELSSRLDSLGVSYAATEPEAGFARVEAARLARRVLIGEFLGLPVAGITQGPVPPEDLALAAGALFSEADWMLPDYR